jgi:hypothetical protein
MHFIFSVSLLASFVILTTAAPSSYGSYYNDWLQQLRLGGKSNAALQEQDSNQAEELLNRFIEQFTGPYASKSAEVEDMELAQVMSNFYNEYLHHFLRPSAKKQDAVEQGVLMSREQEQNMKRLARAMTSYNDYWRGYVYPWANALLQDAAKGGKNKQ